MNHTYSRWNPRLSATGGLRAHLHYDNPQGRLTDIKRLVNNEAVETLAQYLYYEHGQLTAVPEQRRRPAAHHPRCNRQVQAPVVEYPGPGGALPGLLGQEHLLPLRRASAPGRGDRRVEPDHYPVRGHTGRSRQHNN